jgi:hypothetical protein
MLLIDHDLGEGRRLYTFEGTPDEISLQLKGFFSSPVVVYKIVVIGLGE